MLIASYNSFCLSTLSCVPVQDIYMYIYVKAPLFDTGRLLNVTFTSTYNYMEYASFTG